MMAQIGRNRSLIVRLALHFFLLHAVARLWLRNESQRTTTVVVNAFSVISNPRSTTKITTGPMGKPATSREEDLRLTIQIIQDFHKLLLVEEKQGEDDDDVHVVSDVTVQEQVAVFFEDESSLVDEAAAPTTTQVQEEEAVSSILKQVEKPAAAEVITSAITPVEESIIEDMEMTVKNVVFEELMETLSRPVFNGPLTRLAAAFGQGLHPSRIASTSVISLSLTQIEIGALVCEDGVCVNVAVPVPFSKPCYYDGNSDILEKCILDAIDELDVLATQRIEASERAQVNTEQISWEKRLFQELQDDSITPVFPDWWTEPTTTSSKNCWELQDECATLKRLLNEDEFQMERHALVQQQLQQQYIQNQLRQGTVTQAAVAFVGTSGLLLRADLELKEEEDDDEVDSITTTTNHIVDLPLLFLDGTAEARTVDDLRAAVLHLVDSVTADR